MIIASVDGLPELTNGRQGVWNGELLTSLRFEGRRLDSSRVCRSAEID